MVLEKKQVVCILVNVICIKMIMTYPRILVQNMGNAAWINIIYVSLIALLLYSVINRVYKSEYGNFLTAAETLGGRGLKITTGVLFASLLILNIAFSVRSYPETVKTVLLTETKMQLIVMAYIATAAIGASFGIENNARIQAIFMPIAAVVMVGFFLLSIPYWKLNNIMPILGNGFEPLFMRGALNITMFSDIVLLNYLMPYMYTKRDIKNSGYVAIIISGIISVIIVGTYNLIYPYPVSKDFILPAYQISRIVRLGMFFQRWEAFFQFVWSIAMYLYTSLYIAVIAAILADAFELKYSRPIVFPVSIITACTAFTMNMKNSADIVAVSSYSMIVLAFCVPVIFGAVMQVKRRRERL